MLGTKCPSITSRWIQSAPAWSTARTSSPSLAKSDARIDGAITRGREVNGWDMGAFPDKGRTLVRLTRANGGGNRRGKFCRGRHLLPGMPGRMSREPLFYRRFRPGTALAEWLSEYQAAVQAVFLGVLPCCSLSVPRRPYGMPCSRWPHRNHPPRNLEPRARARQARSIFPQPRRLPEARRRRPEPAPGRRYRRKP